MAHGHHHLSLSCHERRGRRKKLEGAALELAKKCCGAAGAVSCLLEVEKRGKGRCTAAAFHSRCKPK
jgi:hypothetical protein